MNFYRIYHSTGKDVGYYPQVYDAELNFHIEDKNSCVRLSFSKAREITLWPIPKLSYRAKKTDLISISFIGLSDKLFISSKLHGILQKKESKGIQYIKSELITKKNNEEYWIVNPFLSDYSFLNINECEFVYTDRMLKTEFQNVKFESVESFINAYYENLNESAKLGFDEFRPLIVKKVAFKDNSPLDFFSIAGVIGGIGYYVSQKLKEEIENSGCTGIILKEINDQ